MAFIFWQIGLKCLFLPSLVYPVLRVTGYVKRQFCHDGIIDTNVPPPLLNF